MADSLEKQLAALEKQFEKTRKAAAKREQKRGTREAPRQSGKAAMPITPGQRSGPEILKELKYIEMRHKNRTDRVMARYQTRAQIERKVREEARAGAHRGQIQKVVERRWSATLKRRSVAVEKLLAKKQAELAELMATLAIRPVRALLTYQLSKDVKTTEAEFDTSEATLWGDAAEELAHYLQGDSADLIDVEVLEWGEPTGEYVEIPGVTA